MSLKEKKEKVLRDEVVRPSDIDLPAEKLKAITEISDRIKSSTSFTIIGAFGDPDNPDKFMTTVTSVSPIYEASSYVRGIIEAAIHYSLDKLSKRKGGINDLP